MESEDLESFRQRWQQELQQRRDSRNGNVSTITNLQGITSKSVENSSSSLYTLEGEPSVPRNEAISPEKNETVGSVSSLIESYRNMTLWLLPLNPREQIHVTKLPNELIIDILKQLILIGDVNSIENGFALVCKKFFLLSREISLWRLLCEKTYCENVDDGIFLKNLVQECGSVYGNDWRRMYIET